MSVQNNEQTSSAVIVFQGRPTENREYRILLDGDNLVYEEANTWDRLGVPRFAEVDDGYQALKAFAAAYCKTQKEGGLIAEPVGIAWQGTLKNVDYRILLDGDDLYYEEAKSRDRLGAPQFKEASSDEDVAEALALEKGRALQAAAIDAVKTENIQSVSSLGWHCEQSPDSHCHYFSEEDDSGQGRVVRLNNGEKNPLPTDHDHQHENPDNCIYCGEPEERK